jgi:DNA-binding response OmpR family regulator
VTPPAHALPPPATGTPRCPRLLVVEDERDLAELVALQLRELPAEVTLAHDGGQGLALARQGGFDAMVLDLRLPVLGGLDVCRTLRAEGSRLPLLMLTARNTELDRVLGLELGADDYLAKPFSVLELQARVRALLRRSAFTASTVGTAFTALASLPAASAVGGSAAATTEPSSLSFKDLRIDRVQRRVWRGGQEVALAPREFDLLWHFAGQPGRAFTRAELLADVWGYGHDGYDHTVNSHINRLRDKLGDRRDGSGWIQTVWGVGYRFEAEP